MAFSFTSTSQEYVVKSNNNKDVIKIVKLFLNDNLIEINIKYTKIGAKTDDLLFNKSTNNTKYTINTILCKLLPNSIINDDINANDETRCSKTKKTLVLYLNKYFL